MEAKRNTIQKQIVFDVLTKAGITVVTDRQCKADSVINVNGKGGKQ